MAVKHYPNCNANYPEKPANEEPQQLLETEYDENEVVISCVDCGAFEVIKKQEGR